MSFFLEDPSEEPAALLRQLGNLESSASAKRAIRTQLQRELEDVEAQLQLLSAPSAAPGRARAGTSPSRQRFDRNAALFSGR